MGKEFEIRREVELAAAPVDVWDAVTTGTGGWLWPMAYEPRQGGSGPHGATVTAWDPPHHFANRMDGADGWFNEQDFTIAQRPDGGAFLRYVHSGVFVDDWQTQYEGADRHTDFYLHTLAQYVRFFSRRPVVFATAQAPEGAPFAPLRRRLGLREGTAEGDTLRLALPEAWAVEAVVDYLDPYFVGLRTDDALYRFFGRDAFGGRVAVAVHRFTGGLDEARLTGAWQAWLDGIYLG